MQLEKRKTRKNTYRDLSQEEILKIKSLYFTKSRREISIEMNLSYTATCVYIKELIKNGILETTVRTNSHKDHLILENLDKYVEEIAEINQRTISQIINRIKLLQKSNKISSTYKFKRKFEVKDTFCNLSTDRSTWTKEEDTYLILNIGSIGINNVSFKLNKNNVDTYFRYFELKEFTEIPIKHYMQSRFLFF